MRKEKMNQIRNCFIVLLLGLFIMFSFIPAQAFAKEINSENGAENNSVMEKIGDWLSLSLLSETEPAYIESIGMQNLGGTANASQIIQNDLLDFNSGIKDYTIKLKNGVLVSDNFTVTTTKPISSLDITYSYADGVEKSISPTANALKDEFMIMFSFEQWGQTDITLKLNYGTAVSPRYQIYKIHVLTNTENENQLETFDVVPYSENKPAEILSTIAGTSSYPEQSVVDLSTDKVIVKAVSKVKGATMTLTYKKFANDEDKTGENVTIPITSGVETEITDCFSKAYADYIATQSSPENFTLKFGVMVQPPTTQQARVFEKGITRGVFSPYIFANITCNNKHSNESTTSIYQLDGTQGYKPASKIIK